MTNLILISFLTSILTANHSETVGKKGSSGVVKSRLIIIELNGFCIYAFARYLYRVFSMKQFMEGGINHGSSAAIL